MSLWSKTRTAVSEWRFSIGVLCGVALIPLFATARPPRPTPVAIGDRLPDAQLTTMGGAPVRLAERLGRHGTLIFVVSLADCASCSSLPSELEIIRRQTPAVNVVVVGSGASPSDFAPHLEKLADAAVLVDERRTLLGALKLTREPVTLLVDSAARILLVDSRSTPAAAQYPMGRVLRQLETIVGPTKAPTR